MSKPGAYAELTAILIMTNARREDEAEEVNRIAQLVQDAIDHEMKEKT